MQISPKVSMWIHIVMAVLALIAAGTLPRPSYISPAVGADIVTTAAILVAIISAIGAGLQAYSAPVAGPLAGKATGAAKIGAYLLIAGLLACLALSGRAEATPLHRSRVIIHALQVRHYPTYLQARRFFARSLLPIPLPKPPSLGSAVTSVTTVVANLEKLTLADAQYAAYLAQLAGDTNVETCASGIVNLVNELQPPTPDAGAPPAPAAPANLLTTFAKLHIIAMRVRTGGDLQNACAPLATELKMTGLDVINAVATGSISLTTLGGFVGL